MNTPRQSSRCTRIVADPAEAGLRPDPRVIPRIRLLATVAGVALLIAATDAMAQVTDTVRVPPVPPTLTRPPIDSALIPPISSRRALLYGMLAPGYPQTLLDRPKTAAFFMTVEALAIAFARKSAIDLREAKRHAADSVIATFRIDPATGRVVLDSTGAPVVATYVPNELGILVAARRTHLEDWIATLIFNHLISGAEAFVSAQLWDLPARVSGERREGRSMLRISVPW